MKRKLLSAFIATIVLITSCSKEKIAEPEKKDETLYPVTFNVSTFKSEIVPMANAAKKKADKFAFQGNGLGGQNLQAAGTGDDWLGNKIQSIEYYVYNESGIQVNYISHQNYEWFEDAEGNPYDGPNEKFGIIEDSLPLGKYKVIFTTNYTPVHGDGQNPYVRINPSQDLFVKTIDINVTSAPLELSVILERIVGKLEIKLLDEVPENIGRITYSVKNISAYVRLNGDIWGASDRFENTVYTNNLGYKDNMSFYFGYQPYSSSENTTVNIRAYGKEGNLVIDRIINDVPVGVNKTTILSGKLFEEAGSSKGQGFSVSLQDKWLESDKISF